MRAGIGEAARLLRDPSTGGAYAALLAESARDPEGVGRRVRESLSTRLHALVATSVRARDRARGDPPRHGRRRPARRRGRRVGHAPGPGHRRARRGLHRRAHRRCWPTSPTPGCAASSARRARLPYAGSRRRHATRARHATRSEAGGLAVDAPLVAQRVADLAQRGLGADGVEHRPGSCCRSVRATSTIRCQRPRRRRPRRGRPCGRPSIATCSRSTSWVTRRISSSSVTEPVWQLTPTTFLSPFSSACWYWKAASAISADEPAVLDAAQDAGGHRADRVVRRRRARAELAMP